MGIFVDFAVKLKKNKILSKQNLISFSHFSSISGKYTDISKYVEALESAMQASKWAQMNL